MFEKNTARQTSLPTPPVPTLQPNLAFSTSQSQFSPPQTLLVRQNTIKLLKNSLKLNFSPFSSPKSLKIMNQDSHPALHNRGRGVPMLGSVFAPSPFDVPLSSFPQTSQSHHDDMDTEMLPSKHVSQTLANLLPPNATLVTDEDLVNAFDDSTTSVAGAGIAVSALLYQARGLERYPIDPQRQKFGKKHKKDAKPTSHEQYYERVEAQGQLDQYQMSMLPPSPFSQFSYSDGMQVAMDVGMVDGMHMGMSMNGESVPIVAVNHAILPTSNFPPTIHPIPPHSTSDAASTTSSHSRRPSLGKKKKKKDDRYEKEEAKRFVCEWEGCGKRFNRPSSLKTHTYTHTGEKPFVCPGCQRTFSVLSNLRRHAKVCGGGAHQAEVDKMRGGHDDDEFFDAE